MTSRHFVMCYCGYYSLLWSTLFSLPLQW